MEADRSRFRVARFGEGLAAEFLRSRGATVLGRNVRVGRGEIDLHVLIDGEAAAIEVKTRASAGDHDAALLQFTREKADTVRRYARRLRPPAFRVDLVAVTIHEGGVDLHWLPYAA